MLHTEEMQKFKYEEEPTHSANEPWEDWTSQSSVSLQDEAPPASPGAPLSLAAERAQLARELAAERARGVAAARAHDARLAELHAVIAELVRRQRARAAIAEEDAADECESTTQPAGELDRDEQSRTEQIESSSLSPDALPLDKVTLNDDVTDDVTNQRCSPMVAGASGSEGEADSSHVTDSEAPMCTDKRPASCQRERGSPDGRLYIPAGSLQYRRAKIASRVTLPRTSDCDATFAAIDQAQCEAARAHDKGQLEALLRAWRARAAHLAADNCTLRHALGHANDTQHRLRVWCAAQESSCVCVCAALSAADRALECYDVLLALRESSGTDQRVEAERVALSLLRRLQASPSHPAPLLSPGPWADTVVSSSNEEWSSEAETALRAHCARLKTDTVTLRHMAAPPALYSHYDAEESEQDGESVASRVNMADMEDAVELEERTLAAEARAAALLAAHTHTSDTASHRRRKERHKHTNRHNETQL